MQKICCESKTKGKVGNQQGFTLIEIISVLIILGVMVSVIIKKFDFLQDNASITALQAGIQELKARESVAWFKLKLSDNGYTNDADVFSAVNKNIGTEYNWDIGPGISGGRLQFKSQSVDLNRIPSTPNSPGSWI
jgi:prepilin-type N-terminal cleavage/methylation domain-containing protein